MKITVPGNVITVETSWGTKIPIYLKEHRNLTKAVVGETNGRLTTFLNCSMEVVQVENYSIITIHHHDQNGGKTFFRGENLTFDYFHS